MNIYRQQFVSHCPNNGLHIIYSLEIQTDAVIHVYPPGHARRRTLEPVPRIVKDTESRKIHL